MMRREGGRVGRWEGGREGGRVGGRVGGREGRALGNTPEDHENAREEIEEAQAVSAPPVCLKDDRRRKNRERKKVSQESVNPSNKTEGASPPTALLPLLPFPSLTGRLFLPISISIATPNYHLSVHEHDITPN